jgi:hypothetical protein
VLGGVGGCLQLLLQSMSRPSSFSILPCWTSFMDSVFTILWLCFRCPQRIKCDLKKKKRNLIYFALFLNYFNLFRKWSKFIWCQKVNPDINGFLWPTASFFGTMYLVLVAGTFYFFGNGSTEGYKDVFPVSYTLLFIHTFHRLDLGNIGGKQDPNHVMWWCVFAFEIDSY